MTPETLKDVCWIGEDHVEGPIRGVILAFHGLGCTERRSEPVLLEPDYAAAGGLVVFPYYGPWSWMNARARAMLDGLVEAVFAKYRLPDSTPVISTGGSMGGLSSLIYTRYANRPIKACFANCPVCDLKFHFGERPDLPATFRHAADYPDDLELYFHHDSPLRQVADMPDIPYLLVHGGRDKAVSKANHSDKFVAAMRQAGRRIEYVEVPKMGHCSPLPLPVAQRVVEFVRAALA